MAAGGMKANFGCHLPPPVPPNTVIRDVRNKPWTLGKVLGHGGFGAIYTAQPGKLKKVEDGAEYVVKVEPHSNGPLFVELHALLRLGREQPRAEWKPRQGDKPAGWVGIPAYETHGSFTQKGDRLRFLIMTRFGSDLEKVFQGGEKPFPVPTVLNVGVQTLNTLEYIHSHNYCHNDIKAANLLLDSEGKDVFLVDYGLACKYRSDQGFHCDGVPDDRKAHEGTLEYTSRDAHTGVHSRRGDLESLGYCLIHWAGGRLPWAHLLQGDPEDVENTKLACLANMSSFLSSCFRPSPPPLPLVEYWEEVIALEFHTCPDYPKLRNILTEAILPARPHEARLMFSGKTLKVRSRKSEVAPELHQDYHDGARKTRSRDDPDGADNSNSWPDMADPRDIMREASRLHAEEAEARRDPEKEADMARRQEESLENPTREMSRLLELRASREKERQGMSWKDQLVEFNRRKVASCEELQAKDTTPQMDQVMAILAARLAQSGAPATPSPEHSEEEEDTVEEEDDAGEEGDDTAEEGNDAAEEGEEIEMDEVEEQRVEKVVRFAARNTRRKEQEEKEMEEESRGKENTSPKSRSLRPRRKTVEVVDCHVGASETEVSKTEVATARTSGRRKSVPALKTQESRGATRSRSTRNTRHSTISDEECSPLLSPSRLRRRSPRRSRSEVSSPPSVQASPNDAPSSAHNSPKTPQRTADCVVCTKNINVKSMARHLREVHKRALPDTPSRGATGFTPAVKKPRSCRTSPVTVEEEENLGLRRSRRGQEEVDDKRISGRKGQEEVEERRAGRRGLEEVETRLARVSVSSDSPEKIHHLDSPAVTERRLGNVIASFRRGLVLD